MRLGSPLTVDSWRGSLTAHILFFCCFLFGNNAFASENAPSHSEPPKGHAAATPTPLTYHARKIVLPQPRYLPLKETETVAHSFAKWRYNVVFVFASWNARSSRLASLLRQENTKFKARSIGIVGLASHDTPEQLAKWCAQSQPPFPVGLADSGFIDALTNPKVPTIWLTNDRGEILHRLILPTDEEIADAIAKLYLWTEF